MSVTYIESLDERNRKCLINLRNIHFFEHGDNNKKTIVKSTRSLNLNDINDIDDITLNESLDDIKKKIFG